ncbi:MAG: flagellar type III secretion system pore protein FliP [Oscillospiraceae bacterium]
MTDALVNINGEGIQTLEILLFLTVMTLLPSILIMMTSFARILIVLSFTRTAIGTQQTPPNTLLVGIALFLTLFIMSPVIKQINEEAYIPYKNQDITQTEALEKASVPLKDFMLRQTEVDTLETFLDFSGQKEQITDYKDIPLTVVVPAFMTSELKRAFFMGFLIMIPFLLIDMVVASTLMSMGMVMLPPATIAMPFKLLLFVVANGWELMFSTLVRSFN